MGLDTTHDAWHGAYSAFSRWRNAVAVAAGYEVVRITSDGWTRDDVDIDWSIYRDENYQGEWTNGPFIDDPLLHLIVHSDCDGVIHPKHARPLAVRLESLLPKLDESKSGGHIWSMREVTQQFIDGLRLAADADEDVEFR
jgi:hypothetical protein